MSILRSMRRTLLGIIGIGIAFHLFLMMQTSSGIKCYKCYSKTNFSNEKWPDIGIEKDKVGNADYYLYFNQSTDQCKSNSQMSPKDRGELPKNFPPVDCGLNKRCYKGFFQSSNFGKLPNHHVKIERGCVPLDDDNWPLNCSQGELDDPEVRKKVKGSWRTCVCDTDNCNDDRDQMTFYIVPDKDSASSINHSEKKIINDDDDDGANLLTPCKNYYLILICIYSIISFL